MTKSCCPVAEPFAAAGDSFTYAFGQIYARRKPKQLDSMKLGAPDIHDLSALSALKRLSAEVQQLRAGLEQARVERDMLQNGHRILCLTSIAWGRKRKEGRRHISPHVS